MRATLDRTYGEVRSAAGTVVETGREWIADKASTQAGDLSFRVVLALAPLVIIAVAVVGLVYQNTAVLDELLGKADDYLGEQTADAVRIVLDNMARPKASTVALVIGTVTLLWAAAGAFRSLQKSLNAIWNVSPAPLSRNRRRLLPFVLNHLAMLALVLALGLALAALLALASVWSIIADRVTGSLPAPELTLRGLDFIFGLALATVAFATLFSVVPLGRLPQRYVWLSALVTAFLFSLGRIGFGIYMSYSGTASAYGAAGSLIVFLLWVYYSAMIMFFGAELAQVWARRRGVEVEPRRGAVRMAPAAPLDE